LIILKDCIMYDEPYLGTVGIFGGNFAPRGWLLCNGQLLSIAEESTLFAILGTTFGGDGQTTFGVPDLRGRIAIGTGQGPGQPNFVIGQRAGSESVTITVSQMPAHAHAFVSITGTMNANINTGGTDSPAAAFPAKPGSALYNTSADGGGMAPNNVTAVSPAAGASGPVATMSPYLAMNYVIATSGIFPSRN
jgi:microcystin-dependent protein